MNPITNVGANTPLNPIQKTIAKPAAEQSPPVRGQDKLELSGAAHLLQALKTGKDVRADKVADIKAQIEAGKYEDDYKLDIAADRLLDDLLK